MEQIGHLLNYMDNEEDSDETESSPTLLEYKLKAIECERRIQENRKRKHRKLLEKVAMLDDKFKERRVQREIHTVASSGNFGCKAEAAALSPTTVKDVKDELKTIQNDIVDKNFNYISRSENLEVNEELNDNFTKLGDLKKQEKMLQDWYNAMSEQLEAEQKRLEHNFKEMKVKILQQKQYYLKTSQECINNLSNMSVSGLSNSQHKSVCTDGNASRRYGTDSEMSVSHSKVSDKDITDYSQRYGTGLRAADTKKQLLQDAARLSSHSNANSFHELTESTLGMSPIHASKYTPEKMPTRRGLYNQYERNDSGENDVKLPYGFESMDRKVGSSSTPVGKTERRFGEINREEGVSCNRNSTVAKEGFERLAAVGKGHLTRKLMKTDKVQEVIKTIKDTRAVLADLNKEDKSVHKKLHETKADELLRATVQQELQNAMRKFHSILLASSPVEQVEIIARSRTAAFDRQTKQINKDSGLFSNQGKRLSSVTRMKMKKRQEGFPKDSNTTRPQTSPLLKERPGSRKQRKSWDVRSFKPTPSTGSPFHYTRISQERTISRCKKESAIYEEKGIPAKCEVQRGPVVRKLAKKKVLAATLNRKIEASNG